MSWLLSEDAALKAKLQGLTVTDMTSGDLPGGIRQVPVRFRLPMDEMVSLTFPVILIEFSSMAWASPRQHSGRIQLPYAPEGPCFSPTPAWCSSRTSLPAPRSAPYTPRRDLAEMRARRRQAQRPGECRLHGATSHLLRDARQFLLRRLLQGCAIELAWNLVTREFGLAEGPALVTVYAEDDEAARALGEIAGLPTSRIIRIATSDNFWAMGDTGPCGPCSEIFYDHGDDIAGGPPGSADADGDRFIEIWNLVFMQFEQHADGSALDLPRPSIDTGMGLERIAAVLQGKHDNYDTDILRALMVASAEASGVDRRRAARGIASRHRRSSARVVLPHRRRRAAIEGGARLCAAPDHAPRHAACAYLGREGPAAVAAGAGAGAADGRRLSRADPRRAAHHRDAEARGGRLQETAGPRPKLLDEEEGQALVRRSPSRARRRSSFTTPTAFRSTSPRTCCAGAAERSRSPASTRRWPGSARTRARLGGIGRGRDRGSSGSSCARNWAPPISWATTRTIAEGNIAHHHRRQGRRRGERRHRSRDHRQPDAFLWRDRADRWAIPARCSRRRAAQFAVRDTQKKAGDLIVHVGR